MQKESKHTALITGGIRGIGLAIAKELYTADCRVILTYLSDEAEAGIAISSFSGIQPKAFQCDVTSRESVKDLFKQLKQSDLTPDIVVNNAGVISTNYIRFMTEKEWHQPIETSLTGSFNITQAALRGMMRKKWGRIINIASDAALLGDAMRASYAAAKSGLLGLTRTTAREVAQMGITVNAIAPGIIKTRMTADMPPARHDTILNSVPMGRFGDPSEVATVISFLTSDKASYITGETISVDGGLYMRR